jgi:hypothetical protein
VIAGDSSDGQSVTPSRTGLAADDAGAAAASRSASPVQPLPPRQLRLPPRPSGDGVGVSSSTYRRRMREKTHGRRLPRSRIDHSAASDLIVEGNWYWIGCERVISYRDVTGTRFHQSLPEGKFAFSLIAKKQVRTCLIS